MVYPRVDLPYNEDYLEERLSTVYPLYFGNLDSGGPFVWLQLRKPLLFVCIDE